MTASPSQWLDSHARARPQAPALIDGGTVWTARDLLRAVETAAAGLAGLGASPGTIVAVATRHPLTLALLHLACPRLGGALLPLDPDMPAAVRTAVLAQAGPHLCLSADDARRLIAGAPGASPPPRPRPYSPPPDALHLVIATSGSTGTPKAVMLTGRAIDAHVRASNARLGLTAGDSWLVCLPLFHIGGAAILWRCLYAGVPAVLGGRFDAVRVRDTIRRRSVTHLSLVPAMLHRMLDADPVPPPSLRRILVGGAALSGPLARRALAHGWPICPTWGMSETCSQAATLADPGDDWAPGTVGRPLAGLEVEAVTPDPGGAGRLRIRGPMVMAGYLTPGRRPGAGLCDGWLETNDLGRVAPDGTVTVLGRADDMLLSGGKTIHPATVEDLMDGCPDLGAHAVTGSADPVWGDILVVAYTGQASAESVLAWARARLPSALRPRAACPVETLPETALGKLDRRALRRRVEQKIEPGAVGMVEPES